MQEGQEIAKSYDPKINDLEINKLWEESGFFNPDNLPGKRKKVFSMVLPPPNVTGTLHLGHSLMLIIQDILVRYHRMKGFKTLWIPGTDHAAIATQEKVEKELYKKEEKTRHDLGRDEFLKRVEQFASESHDTIINQVKKMGASIDWSREAFTLDEKRNLAVKTAFKKMYDACLIYRGEKVINWDPKGQTTISDDEVSHQERDAVLYTFKYSSDFPIPIATTRPETKVGDVAVAINPKDTRYKEFIGKEYKVNFCGENLNIKVISDPSIDKDFGTGALGLTPAHSKIDEEIAKKNNLGSIQVIDERAKMILPNNELLNGKKVLEARVLVVEWLKANNLLIKEENIKQNVAVAERSGGIIEPLPKRQWFVDVNKKFVLPKSNIKGIKSGAKTTLKEIMERSVKNGQIAIIPDRFKKIYFHWIENLHDWCISRQIWYGHRIPVWYCASCNETKINTEVKSRWFLVRHGQTDWNKNKISMGQKDIPLNDEGRRQAKETAQKLKNENIDLIISSHLSRCRETAEIISKELGGKEIIFEKDFQERSYGDAEGITHEESDKRYGNLFNYESKAPNGESYKELEERAWKVFKNHNEKHHHKNVIVVSHGGTIRTLLKRIHNWEVERMFANESVKNAESIKFDISNPCLNCKGIMFRQDPDTLDTWFSSGLWTFSTMGWPFTETNGKPTEDFKTYHPTSVLETGPDILFFWVARMILMSGFLLGDIPFKNIYLHGIVRDKNGVKMSKSKNNGIDPLDMIDKFGTDALRMSMISGISPGNDVNFSEDKTRGYRNFATKLWNIGRFIKMNNINGYTAKKIKLTSADKKKVKFALDLKNKAGKNIEKFKFNEAAYDLYHYAWHEFADKIIEEAKPRLKSEDLKDKLSALKMLKDILFEILKSLHPFMPFATEAIYREVWDIKDPKNLLMISEW